MSPWIRCPPGARRVKGHREALPPCHSFLAHTRCCGTLRVLNQLYCLYDLIDLVRPDKKSIGKKYMYLPRMGSPS